MINFTQEGQFKKIGLNLYRSAGGFVIAWLWYDVAKHELNGWRFRVRMHMAPRIYWSKESCNVIVNYLSIRGLTLVNQEVLEDLKAVEDADKQVNERFAYIKP